MELSEIKEEDHRAELIEIENGLWRVAAAIRKLPGVWEDVEPTFEGGRTPGGNYRVVFFLDNSELGFQSRRKITKACGLIDEYFDATVGITLDADSSDCGLICELDFRTESFDLYIKRLEDPLFEICLERPRLD